MRRREFIALFSSAAGWSFAAAAQTSTRTQRVGFLGGTSSTAGKHYLEAFRQALKELGWQTITLEVRWSEGRLERMPELAAELVGLNLDVLVAGAYPAARAAKAATGTMPIVMFTADPVGQGLVASLARHGGNLTGLSWLNEALIGKRLELLKELVPGLARIAVLRNPLMETHGMFWEEAEAAARKLGVVLHPIDARRPEDFEGVFAVAARDNTQALLAFDDPLTLAHRSRIVALADWLLQSVVGQSGHQRGHSRGRSYRGAKTRKAMSSA